MCGSCHQQNDAHQISQSNDQYGRDVVPTFQCPLCRAETIIPYNLRPPNVTLNALLGEPEAVDKNQSHASEAASDEHIRDIGAAVLQFRRVIAQDISTQIISQLIDAARSGQLAVTFVGDFSRRAAKLSDVVVPLLFARGVYQVVVSDDMFIVHLAPEPRVAPVFTNPRFVHSEGSDLEAQGIAMLSSQTSSSTSSTSSYAAAAASRRRNAFSLANNLERMLRVSVTNTPPVPLNIANTASGWTHNPNAITQDTLNFPTNGMTPNERQQHTLDAWLQSDTMTNSGASTPAEAPAAASAIDQISGLSSVSPLLDVIQVTDDPLRDLGV